MQTHSHLTQQIKTRKADSHVSTCSQCQMTSVRIIEKSVRSVEVIKSHESAAFVRPVFMLHMYFCAGAASSMRSLKPVVHVLRGAV